MLLSSLTAFRCFFSPSSTFGGPAFSTAAPIALYASDMSLKALESVFWTSSGVLLSEVSFWMAALADSIFFACGCTASQTCLAQASSSSLESSPPHPVSASTSTAPPDSAAASFLFTGLVPSMALGPGTYTPHGRHLPVKHPLRHVYNHLYQAREGSRRRRSAHSTGGRRVNTRRPP